MSSLCSGVVSQSLGSGSNWWDKLYYSVVLTFTFIAAIDGISLFARDGPSCTLHWAATNASQGGGGSLNVTIDLGEAQTDQYNQCCENYKVYLPWQALGAVICAGGMLLPFAYWRFAAFSWTLSLRPSLNAIRMELGSEASETELQGTGGRAESTGLEVPKGTGKLLRILSSIPCSENKSAIWAVVNQQSKPADSSPRKLTTKIFVVLIAAIVLVLGFAILFLFLGTMVILWVLPSLGPVFYAMFLAEFGRHFTTLARYDCASECAADFPEYIGAWGICHRPREDRAIVGVAIAAAVIGTIPACIKIWWILSTGRVYMWARTTSCLLKRTEALCKVDMTFHEVGSSFPCYDL